MTTILADGRLSQDMKDAVASAIDLMAGRQAAADILSAFSGTLVVTDRLPTSASVLDPSTGLRTVVTDPALIAAMLPGAHVYVGGASSGPDGVRDIVFDWSGVDLGGASADGLPVLYLGSEIVDSPGHQYQVAGAYGMASDMTLDRVLTGAVARAFADASGTFEGGEVRGLDHGVGFAAIVDGMAYTRGAYDPDHQFYDLMGPGSYGGGSNGNYTYSQMPMYEVGTKASFSVDAQGSVVVEIASDGSSIAAGLTRLTLSSPGHEVLGVAYENYARHEYVGSSPVVVGAYQDMGLTYEAAISGVPQHTAFMINAAGVVMDSMDSSFALMAEAGPDDGAAAVLAEGLGLSGFTSHALGQTRILSAANLREINMSSTGVAYGAQVEGGDVRYDATGLAAAGSDRDPSVIALDDRGSLVDTILVGTGRLENVNAGETQFGNNTNELHDNRFSTNHIEAGDGNDVIGTVRPETWPAGLVDLIHGNGGNDLILLNTIDAEAFGDDGDDVIAVGMGDQVVHGGAGHDTLIFDGNIYTFFGVNFDARTGFGEFVSDGFYHTTRADGFERVVGSKGDDVIVGVEGMVVDGQLGNDDISIADMGVAIGGQGDDTYRLEVAQSGTSHYLLMGMDAGDRLFLDGVQHFGSQGSAGADGTVDWRSGGGDNPWNTDRGADADPLGDFWTEDFFHGTDATHGGESLSKLLIQHHVGGAVVASTEIYMTGYSNGDAGLTFERLDASGAFVSTASDDYGLRMDQTAHDVLALFQPSAAPPVADMFGLV